MISRWRAHPRAPYLLLLVVLLVSFLPGPVLLGVWESLTFYHTFGAITAPLTFRIAPRANIGGQGYALLEIARLLIAHLHLPLNLFTFRLPALAFGIVSLLLFFRICRRYFGHWPALGATALLAGNQLFFQVEHMSSVLVISGAAILFVIERLQTLEVDYTDYKEWALLVLALTLIAPHYGLARIYTVILVGLWIAKTWWLLRETPGSEPIRRGIRTLLGYSAAASVLLLTALNARNLISVLSLPQFLFPRNSEIAVLQLKTGGPAGAGVLRMIWVNLQIFLESLLGRPGHFSSAYSSYFLADFRYPLLSFVVLPFVILGLIVAITRAKRRTIVFATPWANVLAILAVFLLPLLFSYVTFKPDGLVATLSDHRLYFCLFPLYMSIAAFLDWLRKSKYGDRANYAVAALITVVFAVLVVNLTREHSRFERQVFAPTWREHGPGIVKIWDDGMPNVDRHDYVFFSHLQQHSQYANVGREIAAALGANRTPAVRRLVFVDINLFSEAPIAPGELDYISHRNYHSIFLALYAGQAGAQVNPIVMVDSSREPVIVSALGYEGTPREFSARTSVGQTGLLGYEVGLGTMPVLVQISGDRNADILVTTPEEESGARAFLAKQGIRFAYLKL